MTIKYNYNFSIFTNEDEVSYYLLGAFMTDGCVYKNNQTTYACQLSSSDYDWLNDIKNMIGTNLNLHKFKENYYGIRITRNEIAQWFISHGCCPGKTLTLKLPIIPQQYMPDLLRGCIDGDGSIGTYISTKGKSTKRTCCLISASKEFLHAIQDYLSSKDIKSGITEKKQKTPNIINGKSIIQKHKCYCLYTSGINCYKLLRLIYYSNHKISLLRKYKLSQDIISFYETNEITDKRKLRPLNIRCKIQWPSDDDLLSIIHKSNIEKIAITLGVSGSAIRNRLKNRNLYEKVKINKLAK